MLKRTPLYEVHTALGARMVPFAGWEMPVQYSGVIEEHLAVRSACGLFDVSHMGEIEISGENAIDFVQLVMTNDVESVKDGQCQYTPLCYDDGGVVDDTIVYRYNIDRYLFVVNASNVDKVFEWFKKVEAREALSDVSIENLSAQYAQLALQGPKSAEVINKLLDISPEDIRHFHFHMGLLNDEIEVLVSRTGYTGEDGFEIYLDPSDAVAAWKSIMDAGKDYGILPIGLGARDTLRLEMGYPLYGHELSEQITPIEASLGKYVKFNKDFIGREVLERQAQNGTEKTLVGLTMVETGIPRTGYEILSGADKVGHVSSGTSSPSLKTGIAMGFVRSDLKAVGTELQVNIRERAAKARVVKTPFYKKK